MASIKNDFFSKGCDKQKRSDVTIYFKRPDRKNLKKWTLDQKVATYVFLKDLDVVYKAFVKEIKSAIK